MRYSKAELILMWIDVRPEDAEHPDLEQMATAGYVESSEGFMEWDEFVCSIAADAGKE